MKKAHCALLATLTSLSLAPRKAAAAESTFLNVSTEACPGLRTEEVDRILRIELAALAGGWQGAPLLVELSCDGARVRVVADDPLTQKRLERTLDLGSVPRDRDRTVALVVSQLFLTSWAELLIEDRRQVLAPVVATPPAPPAVTQKAETLTRDAMTARPWHLSLAALGGARVRALDAPIVTVRGGARPMLSWGEHARLFLDLGYERASVSRPLGRVGASLASAALGAGYRTSRRGPFSFEANVSGGAAWVDVSGDARADARGASDSGAVAEVGLALGPTFSFGVVHLGLELAGGITFPRAVARVTQGDDVSLSGPWAGASVVLAAEDAK